MRIGSSTQKFRHLTLSACSNLTREIEYLCIPPSNYTLCFINGYKMLICDFEVIRPTHESLQEETLKWMLASHLEASKDDPLMCPLQFKSTFDKVSCKPAAIKTRGHMVKDYLHTDWETMALYNVKKRPEGASLSERSNAFAHYVDPIFERYYPAGSAPPDELIHVSCTGYLSPSGAQKIVSTREWGKVTTVTHAYHMGCYAAIPALRIGWGSLLRSATCQQVDVVHTEVCSLHTHPASHGKDQLVCQTLFADGFIKYSLKKHSTRPHLKMLAVHEEIIPSSQESMQWKVGAFGFEMTLLKEIPLLLTRALRPFLEKLSALANTSIEELVRESVFAVHPGGPKILSYVEKELALTPAQMGYSVQILRDCGNMSSATLPHIWDQIVKDPAVPAHTKIVSLAFGPGLTIVGNVLEVVRCGC